MLVLGRVIVAGVMVMPVATMLDLRVMAELMSGFM